MAAPTPTSTSSTTSSTSLTSAITSTGSPTQGSTSSSSDSTSSSIPSSTSTPVQPTTSSPTTSSSSSVSTTSSSSHSHTPQNAGNSVSTTSSQSLSSSASAHASPTNSPTGSHRLSNGAVAGIVIAVALGIALLTFLATFLLMRRRQQSKGKRRYPSSRDSGGFELNTSRKQDQTPISKTPFATATSGGSGTYENYLPQSADDKTVQQRVKAILDQFELHIENFYLNSSSSALKPDNAELAVFDSPYLPASLASLLPRSKNKLNIMKHALAQSVTSSISPSANPARSLLPSEYALLPNTVKKARSSMSTTPGSTQIMSRWRVMTAYLRPDPTKDAAYIAQRDRQISDTVQSFAKAFASWKNTGYKDEERTRSLSAILEDATDLGIFLFSQPSTLKFLWPSSSEVGPGRIVISPALVKSSDEKGQELVEAQVMINKVVLDA